MVKILSQLKYDIQQIEFKLKSIKKAKQEMLSLKGLSKFEMILRNNVGLRNQDRLPKEIVPKISSCKAVHNDISLSF